MVSVAIRRRSKSSSSLSAQTGTCMCRPFARTKWVGSSRQLVVSDKDYITMQGPEKSGDLGPSWSARLFGGDGL